MDVEVEKTKWDVSDIDPTTMFAKDCRYYNGGLIAPENVQLYWSKSETDLQEMEVDYE